MSLGVSGIFNIDVWSHELLEETARLAATVGVMGAALRVPSSYTRGHWWSVAVMLGIAMPFDGLPAVCSYTGSQASGLPYHCLYKLL